MPTTGEIDGLDAVPARRDYGGWLILLANGLALAIALWQDWRLVDLVFPFWIQSIVIGLFSYLRMLKLRTFSTVGLLVNGKPVDPTPKTRRSIANFFALHYGLFHLAYFVFIGALAGGEPEVAAVGDAPQLDQRLIYVALTLSFLISHGLSHYEHVAADLAGEPNIGTLMFMPYLRIVPMHLTIVCGAIAGGSLGIVFFMVLKTAADLGMHRFEHRTLAGKRDERGSGKRVRDAHEHSDGGLDAPRALDGRRNKRRKR